MQNCWRMWAKKFTCCPARAVFTFVQLFSTVRFQKSLPTARRAQCLPFLAHQSGLQSIIRDRCGKSHDALCLILVELPNTTWIYFQCNSRQISHSHHLLVDIWGRTHQGEYSLSSFVLLGSLSLLYIRYYLWPFRIALILRSTILANTQLQTRIDPLVPKLSSCRGLSPTMLSSNMAVGKSIWLRKGKVGKKTIGRRRERTLGWRHAGWTLGGGPTSFHTSALITSHPTLDLVSCQVPKPTLILC